MIFSSQFSKKDSGIYEVILKDERGKDKSTLKLVDAGKSALKNNIQANPAKVHLDINPH